MFSNSSFSIFYFWRFSRNIDKFSNFAPKTMCLTVSTTCCVLRRILDTFLENKDERAFFELQVDTKMAKVEQEMKVLQTKIVELYLAFAGKLRFCDRRVWVGLFKPILSRKNSLFRGYCF